MCAHIYTLCKDLRYGSHMTMLDHANCFDPSGTTLPAMCVAKQDPNCIEKEINLPWVSTNPAQEGQDTQDVKPGAPEEQ